MDTGRSHELLSQRQKTLLLLVIAAAREPSFFVSMPSVPVCTRRHEEGHMALVLVHALCCIIGEKHQTQYLMLVSKQLWKNIFFVLSKIVCYTNILEKHLGHRAVSASVFTTCRDGRNPWEIDTFKNKTKSPCPEETLLLA